MLMMDTAICIIDINGAIREITLTLTAASEMSLADRYALKDGYPWTVEDALYGWMVSI